MGLDTKSYWLSDRQSQCDLELLLGHPVPGGSKYGNLALQVVGVSNVVVGPVELGAKNDCASESQQQL
jgi:hypothetical protein